MKMIRRVGSVEESFLIQITTIPRILRYHCNAIWIKASIKRERDNNAGEADKSDNDPLATCNFLQKEKRQRYHEKRP